MHIKKHGYLILLQNPYTVLKAVYKLLVPCIAARGVSAHPNGGLYVFVYQHVSALNHHAVKHIGVGKCR